MLFVCKMCKMLIIANINGHLRLLTVICSGVSGKPINNVGRNSKASKDIDTQHCLMPLFRETP